MQWIDLALECPTGLLRTINNLGDFDLISVDQFLDDKSYSLYFLDKPRRQTYLSTRRAFTFGPVEFQDIYKVWFELDGECSVIGPDTYNDKQATLNAYLELESRLGVVPIGVVQGSTLDEARGCLDYYGERVALPFDVASPLDASLHTKTDNRAKLVNLCKDRKVHLLGMTCLEELAWYRGLDQIKSMNTGLPIRLGLSGMSIVGYGEEKERDSRQYMDMYSQKPPVKEAMDLILRNIEKLKEVLDG